ncbi:MAG: shikimate kinase [Lachnospiraceae bacterium]|nr:shikimate kinase [Lachnospiraceae bacterium]
MNNLILIGFMGSGKTTVGEILSSKLGIPAADSDAMIEKQENMSVNEIFSRYGENAFRDMETELLVSLQSDPRRRILSAGGGMPVREINRKLMKKLGTVIYLQADTETLLGRLEGDTTRPKLKGGDLRSRIESLMAQREAIYQAASSLRIRTDGKTPDEVADEILRCLQDH